MDDPDDGVRAVKLLRSGVMVWYEEFAGWGRMEVEGVGVFVGCWELDHEKTGVGEVLLLEVAICVGLEVLHGLSIPGELSVRLLLLGFFPSTSFSKSPSAPVSSMPFDSPITLKDMMSSVRSFRESLAELEARS